MPDQTPKDAPLWTSFAEHPLQAILVIALCSFIRGVDNWADMELLGEAKWAWWRTFFISSLPAEDAVRLASVVRTHCAVENDLHWSLDVAFREEESPGA